jgi:hypothetical protein
MSEKLNMGDFLSISAPLRRPPVAVTYRDTGNVTGILQPKRHKTGHEGIAV